MTHKTVIVMDNNGCIAMKLLFLPNDEFVICQLIC